MQAADIESTTPDLGAMEWPDDAARWDLTGAQQATDGSARCSGVWVCGADGRPRREFAQGETAVFYAEFEAHRDLETPIAGVVLRMPDGTVAHGKGTIQHGCDVPDGVPAGMRFRIRQEIAMELAMGSYQVGVGIAAMTREDYARREDVPWSTIDGLLIRVCDVDQVGWVTVVEPKVTPIRLLHHGVANLPGRCEVAIVDGSREEIPASFESSTISTSPALVHITHWKAGSQWIYGILNRCVPADRIVPPHTDETQLMRSAIVAGKVYPTVYLSRHKYEAVARPENCRHFVMIRDLRDTLVSAYYSMKSVHPVLGPVINVWRKALSQLNTEEGLIYLMDEWLPVCASIQASWIGHPVVRYEELLLDDANILERVLIDECGLDISRDALRQAVDATRFESLTRGRARGQEDLTAHERKGISGDWRNHFTPRLTEAFKARYGNLLIATGYETDLNWS